MITYADTEQMLIQSQEFRDAVCHQNWTRRVSVDLKHH